MSASWNIKMDIDGLYSAAMQRTFRPQTNSMVETWSHSTALPPKTASQRTEAGDIVEAEDRSGVKRGSVYNAMQKAMASMRKHGNLAEVLAMPGVKMAYCHKLRDIRTAEAALKGAVGASTAPLSGSTAQLKEAAAPLSGAAAPLSGAADEGSLTKAAGLKKHQQPGWAKLAAMAGLTPPTSPMQATARPAAPLAMQPPTAPPQLQPQMQYPQSAVTNINQAHATMQQFLPPPPTAGQGSPQVGLDGPSDTRAAAMPGTPGHAATNVIDQQGGLDPRGQTVDGNNAAGVAKGFKMAESTHTRDTGTYDVDSLIKLLQASPTESVPLSDVGPVNRSKKTGFSTKRYDAADTQYPLILDQANKLVDGRHRAAKLQDTGLVQSATGRAENSSSEYD